MEIQSNVLLAPYTTFKIGGPAKYFCIVKDQFDALEAFEFSKKNNLPTFILGGGSNLLVSDRGFAGMVIKIENRGIELLAEDESNVWLKVASGENWDEVVKFSVQNGWWGIENLSHIPGSTGAIAVQNVGAYGQEAMNVIDSVTVFNRETGQINVIKNADCAFAYRQSIFNSTEKSRYIIFYINFKLNKRPAPNLAYADLQKKFSGQNPSLLEIRQAVTEIRDKKFPFPNEPKKGNAGSFFKNISLTPENFESFKLIFKKHFSQETLASLESKIYKNNFIIKVPTAFLMDICGLKDLEFNGAKINASQPLVIVNSSGQSTASDVLHLAAKVLAEIKTKTGVLLQIEPELLGFNQAELDILKV